MLMAPQKKLRFWTSALLLVLFAMAALPFLGPHKVLEQNKTPHAAYAYDLYERCLRNDGEACLTLSYEYKTGERVPANPQYASYYTQRGTQQMARTFHQACRANEDDSCENLVILLTGGPLGSHEFAGEKQTGEILPIPAAAELREQFVKNCEQKNATACAGAGKLFRHLKKSAQATAFQEEACHFGDWESCALASKSYLVGDGVKLDENKAALLAAQGVEGAIRAFNTLQKKPEPNPAKH